jgi:hypothetical protein
MTISLPSSRSERSNTDKSHPTSQVMLTRATDQQENQRETTGGVAADAERPRLQSPPLEKSQEKKDTPDVRDLPSLDTDLSEFIEWLIKTHGKHHEDLAKAGRWQSELFRFVRIAKAHPDLTGLTARQAFRKVEKVIKAWLLSIREVRPGDDVWERCLDVNAEDAESEFMDLWEKIRYVPGAGPLENALEAAEADPLSLSAEVRDRRSAGYPVFVSLAGHLQVCMGARTILLPVEKVAPLLGVKAMTISRYRHWAIEDGFLRETKEHSFRKKGQRDTATEYVFDVTLFPILAERAAPGTAELFGEALPKGSGKP